MKEIWLVSREIGGWAEAGGIKDVVRDQADTFPRIGWQTHVALPLYGFLWSRVEREGRLAWTGLSAHPTRPVPLGVWVVQEANHTLHFVGSPGFADKASLYTYTDADEAADSLNVRGEGFRDSFSLNLEFQWALVSYWFGTDAKPGHVLGHDGHTGFVPAIARTHAPFGGRFLPTSFAVLIHNAGPGYRQEMDNSPENHELLGLNPNEVRRSLLDHRIDPLVSAAAHAKLGTVSENYASELTTGRNDHWSGPFGRWLRTERIPLTGITNGLSPDDKDPRDAAAAGIPARFDPLRGDWNGKALCRRLLRETLLLKPASVFGRLATWDGPLYVMQGRLTAQKGIDALVDLLSRALREKPQALFLIMAQGERRYEERLLGLARNGLDLGRMLFVNKFDEELSRLVFASGDFFLMPSEYEPCGLTDLKAQLMGNLPIVHRVGGLVKVLDDQTGFSYEKRRGGGFWGAFLRSLYVYEARPERLEVMRRKAFVRVLEDFQWTRILEERYVPWLTGAGAVPYGEQRNANLAQR